MLRLFKWVITGDGHNHKWKVVKEINWSSSDNDSKWTQWIQECEVCGKLNKFDNR